MASFPSRAASTGGVIDVPDVLATRFLKQPPNCISGIRGQQEVDMGGHQPVGMDGTVTGIHNPFHDLQVLVIILRLETHRFPVMA
jgi:hypothetical protein